MTSTAQAGAISGLSLDRYRFEGVSRLMTPALAIYKDFVDLNIERTLGMLGNTDRWRPHIKTAKLASIIERLIENGVRNFKCSTTLELTTACEAGAGDVLMAYPLAGPGVTRVHQIAGRFSGVMISALIENAEQIKLWEGSNVSLFIDVNPGMDRTGIDEMRTGDILELAQAIVSSGIQFRGLHYYDGHLTNLDIGERESASHAGYDCLMGIVETLTNAAIQVPEVITAGTPALPCSLSYSRFRDSGFIHRVSPGTVVYNDCSSLSQLPAELGYLPAAVVISTVVSHPTLARFTCDAGHKTVSADAGVPTCAVIGNPSYRPAKPSEEHLPVDILEGLGLPDIGEVLYLVPRHVCPTVNNFDHAVIVEGGSIAGVERVTARGREAPLV